MGLGAPKRRNKLSHDPNNTNWSNSTNTYGHKILSAQGWKAGDYLGAKNANHADHYTTANASHIRTLLREDNLGLGAQVGKGNAETFGLSLFSGVLGRLNGKSDVEVQKHQSALRDAELRTYHAQKYGLQNFVSGGLLVGDKIQHMTEDRIIATEKRTNTSVTNYEQRRPKKKQRTEDPVVQAAQHQDRTSGKAEPKMEPDWCATSATKSTSNIESRKRKTTKRKSPHDKMQLDTSANDPIPDVHDRCELPQSSESQQFHIRNAALEPLNRTSKKAKRKHDVEAGEESEMAKGTLKSYQEHERLQLRREKRARKEHRRKRKEEKRQSGSRGHSPERGSVQQGESEPLVKPTSPVLPSAIVNGTRHAIRHRYIQQKRMASMDPNAMREILMVSAAA